MKAYAEARGPVVSFLCESSTGSAESLERQRMTRNWWNVICTPEDMSTEEHDEAAS